MLFFAAAGVLVAVAVGPFPFNDAKLPTETRVADLLGRMTLHEKVGQMFMDRNMAFGNNNAPKGGIDEPSTAIPRLGVPEFIFMGQGNVYRGASNGCIVNCCSCFDGKNMSNCCHDGYATQFPQGTGQAATWNTSLIFEMGVVASDESRAMMQFPGTLKAADYRTGASSVINILKDGRWGRAPETYGECPVLTGDIAVAFNKGLSGFETLASSARKHGDRFKVLGNVRHFVAYAGPDSERFGFNAIVSDDDLRLTYLPAWKQLSDAHALGGVMSAISGLNGIPSNAHKAMLTDVLRGEWGFDGYVISDCDTIPAITDDFHYTAGLQQAVAVAVKAGNDLNCGKEFAAVENATLSGFIDEAAVDVAVRRLLTRRVQVGDLDRPKSSDPYHNTIPYSVVDSPHSQMVARRVVAESTVILHNGASATTAGKGVLPLKRGAKVQYAVVGPTADDLTVQAHTYHGTPRKWITLLSALKEAGGPEASFTYIKGCDRADENPDHADFVSAIALAQVSDVIIFIGGLQATMEEEGGDRIDDIGLPGLQLDLIKALYTVGKPTIVITINGGPVSEPFLAAAPNLAWVWCSYFGQDGRGVTDVMFGDVPASGALPYTIPLNPDQLGDIHDYAMTAPPYGKTYRYLQYRNLTGLYNSSIPATWIYNVSVPAAPLYPFGFGLSLVEIVYSKFTLKGGAEASCIGGGRGGGAGGAGSPRENKYRLAKGHDLHDQHPPHIQHAHRQETHGFPIRPAEKGWVGDVVGAGRHNVCATPKKTKIVAEVEVTNKDKHSNGAKVVALFGSFRQADGSPSPVGALPTRQLLAHTKVAIPADSTVTVKLEFDIRDAAGAFRQSWPGLLACWVGDSLGIEMQHGNHRPYVGSPGEGTAPMFANVTLVL